MSTTRRFAALALLAGGGLLYEIALTRVLSVLWFDSFVYVLLSVAVLGIGLGAAAATAVPALRRATLLPMWFALSGVAAAVLVPLLIATSYAGDRVLGTLLVALPYAGIGLAIATLFASDAEASPRLYLADLAGAGLGGLAAAPALDALGGVGAALLAAAAIALGAPMISGAGRSEAETSLHRPTGRGGPARRSWTWWAVALPAALPFMLLATHLASGWPGQIGA